MDWKMKNELLEKYWKGETSLQEDAWLKVNVSDLELSKSEAAYLTQLDAFSNLSMEEEFDMDAITKGTDKKTKVRPLPFYKNIRKIAVAVLILVALTVGMNSVFNNNQVSEAMVVEQTPEEAFEVAKQSLLLISSKLNKGIDCANEWSKFNKTTAKIETRKN